MESSFSVWAVVWYEAYSYESDVVSLHQTEAAAVARQIELTETLGRQADRYEVEEMEVYA